MLSYFFARQNKRIRRFFFTLASSTRRECLHSSRRTFIARENIAAREEDLKREKRERARKIYTEDNISERGILRDVQPRREIEKGRERKRRESGLFLAREDAPHSRGLKNVLLLIYTPFQKLRMHKHRLAQAGLFSHLPPRSCTRILSTM